ncbi:uncharacterized protein LOC123534842 [Mercenaria mercenaria]|uniref:uncharacterized protein LOC123534842 n=1 Tax=Mercenaria mercenaria TaxID=6596 RepID=UPI00234EC039|nr:uncharacterized protein LOC123534842 [Mercenaria mercenaria]
MSKSISCCLCKKRCKPNSRRRLLDEKLKKYASKCLTRPIGDEEYICGACFSVYAKTKTGQPIQRTGNRHVENPLNSPKNVLLKLPVSARSHKTCIVCKKNATTKNKIIRIPSSAIAQAFVEKFIFVDFKNRCCASHLENGHFTQESLNALKENKLADRLSRTDILHLLKNVRTFMLQSKFLNFDCTYNMSDDDFHTLTGISKGQFEDLVKHVDKLRDTEVRTARNCIGIFLVKLRTGLSNKLLSVLFGITPAQIQRSITSARLDLMESFVPENIGFEHISHSQFCENHTTPIAKELFTNADDQAVLVMDGTYIYVQKSSNYEFQRRSYSMHKHRPLVKPMVIVGTDGYILAILGPYFSDGKNNDASITKHMMATNEGNIDDWVKENDTCIVDRGFRDSIEFLEERGIQVHMPSFLKKGQKQHSCEEANQNRLITKVRWVVESANGRLKQFKLLDKVISNNTIPFITDYLQITGALINKYRRPFSQDQPESADIARKMLIRSRRSNDLLERLQETGMLTKRVVYSLVESKDECLDCFPRITYDQLRDITLGVYQLKQAPYYTREHMEDGDYLLYVHKEEKELLKFKIQSRHSNSMEHSLWILFEPNPDDPIQGWYCTCKVGARVVGCCAHVASVIWYLGYFRFRSLEIPGRNYSLLDAGNIPEDESESDISSEEETGSGEEE